MMRIVEVEPAPCQHRHASNYDPATVIPNQPIKVLAGGRLWCFDCKEFFVPEIPPRRYTLEQVETLAKEWAVENEATNDARWIVSGLIAWLAKREREGLDASD